MVLEGPHFIFIGLALAILADIVLAVFFYQRQKTFLNQAIKVKALVVNVRTEVLDSLRKGKKNVVMLDLHYSDHQGRPVEHSIVNAGPTRKVNDYINLFVDKNDPKKITQDQLMSLWAIPMGLAWGAFMLLVVLVFLVFNGQAKLPF